MATTALTLDGFPLIGATPGGGRAKLLEFENWLTATNDRSRNKRSGRAGAWSSPGRRVEKPMTIEGTVEYRTPLEAAKERRRMVALGGLDECLLQVTDPLGTLHQRVEIDDVDIPPVHDELVHYHFRVTALDPFARAVSSETVSVAAGATASHTAEGTAAAEIEVTVTKAGTVDLNIGGLRLRWGSLPVGAVLTSGGGFENPKRTALSATGANLFGLIVQPMQWPAMSPGLNRPHQAGTADLDIRYFPTYS